MLVLVLHDVIEEVHPLFSILPLAATVPSTYFLVFLSPTLKNVGWIYVKL
jgi:hypothetical protein